MDDAVRGALEIDRASSARARTIDITTTGARSGRPRRIEIWFYRAGGRWYLTTVPARRDWYANLRAHPRFTVHLKHGVRADLAATAVPVTDEAARRAVFTEIVDDLNQPSNPGRVSQPQHVQDWVAGSPLAEIVFDDLAGDRPGGGG